LLWKVNTGCGKLASFFHIALTEQHLLSCHGFFVGKRRKIHIKIKAQFHAQDRKEQPETSKLLKFRKEVSDYLKRRKKCNY
jgi:hypothetical protein